LASRLLERPPRLWPQTEPSTTLTGRDLVEPSAGKKPSLSASLILADPSYNLTPEEVAQAVPRRPSVPDVTVASNTRSISDETRGLGRVKRLPGTAAEARQAFEKLKTLTGHEPKLFTEAEASETIVKSTKSPQVLVLATHGFFLKKQEVELNDEPGLELGGEKKTGAVKDKDGKMVEIPCCVAGSCWPARTSVLRRKRARTTAS